MEKGVISDFKKVCQDAEMLLELKLYFAECGTEFTNMYGDIDERFYDSVCDTFHDVVVAVTEEEELFEKWDNRISRIVHDSGGIGWGFHDYLVEEY